MADLKIKLKFGNFEFEIEGDKQSVIEEFKSLKENGISTLIDSIKLSPPEKEDEVDEIIPKEINGTEKPAANKKATPKKSSSKKTVSKSPKQLLDLNLRPNGKISLRDFYDRFEIKSNFERNVTFVYYLSKELSIGNIGIDHIYTAYKEAGQKVPGDIYQSLIDTKKHKGWIDTTNIEDIKLSIQGENYIEHDAPKLQPKK